MDRAPTAGGQYVIRRERRALCLIELLLTTLLAICRYHWTSEFAPPSLQRFLSYISGWLSSLAWACGVASGMFIIGNLIPALISLEHPDFVPHVWHGYLLVVLTCIICFLINGFFARHLPFLEKFVMVFTGLAFIVLIAVPLALSPKLSGAQVFQTFGDSVGSTGMLEIMSAQILIYYSLLGSDSTAHMAEETEHAAIVIPRAMISSYLIIGIACFLTLIAYCFCWVDPDAYESTPSSYPFLAVFVTATGSARGAIGLASIMILLILFSVTNCTYSGGHKLRCRFALISSSCSRHGNDFTPNLCFCQRRWSAVPEFCGQGQSQNTDTNQCVARRLLVCGAHLFDRAWQYSVSFVYYRNCSRLTTQFFKCFQCHCFAPSNGPGRHV